MKLYEDGLIMGTHLIEPEWSTGSIVTDRQFTWTQEHMDELSERQCRQLAMYLLD
ncbi:hypothetical protein [Anaerolentibacter hominis]|uniref:hypothetical protein n=1 Tax=Anaerolentibacter hominis TaxID=3079009 RepID=UPI0031B85B55